MGQDIHGWIEARKSGYDWWFGAAVIGLLADRNYWAFAALFGVNGALDDLPPLAPARGLPADISDQAKADHEADLARAPREFFGETWVTWAEIAAVDWKAPVGNLILMTRMPTEGERPWYTYWYTPSTFEHPLRNPLPPGFVGRADDLQPGQEWEAGDKVYRVVAGTREDLLGADWLTLFRVMEALAVRYGADDVRMTVWFGN